MKESRADIIVEFYRKHDLHDGFIEPQSMNYSTTVSDAYKSFLRKREDADGQGRKRPPSKLVVEDMDGGAKKAGGI